MVFYEKLLYILNKLLISGLCISYFICEIESVLDDLIFLNISSASSDKFILELSLKSDFDIFLKLSFKLITLGNSEVIYSGKGKNGLLGLQNRLLNLTA